MQLSPYYRHLSVDNSIYLTGFNPTEMNRIRSHAYWNQLTFIERLNILVGLNFWEIIENVEGPDVKLMLKLK